MTTLPQEGISPEEAQERTDETSASDARTGETLGEAFGEVIDAYITVVDANGDELYMGTDHDDLTPKADLDLFEAERRLTPANRIARKNRGLVKRIMLAAGFTAHRAEWWRWSYDK